MNKHILNLKKKVSPIVIEKVIFRDESVFSRSLRSIFSIVFVFFIVWGITKGQEIVESILAPKVESASPFSVAGIVKEIDNYKIVLTRSVGMNSNGNVFEIRINAEDQIVETNTYDPIEIDDIQVDDKIIIQGQTAGGILYAKRIISFSPRFPDTEGVNGVIEPDVAEFEVFAVEETATTTEPLATEMATTTEEIMSGATTTDEVLDESSDLNADNEPQEGTASGDEVSPASSIADNNVETAEESTTEPVSEVAPDDTSSVTTESETAPTESVQDSDVAPADEADNSSAETIVGDEASANTETTSEQPENSAESSTTESSSEGTTESEPAA